MARRDQPYRGKHLKDIGPNPNPSKAARAERDVIDNRSNVVAEDRGNLGDGLTPVDHKDAVK